MRGVTVEKFQPEYHRTRSEILRSRPLKFTASTYKSALAKKCLENSRRAFFQRTYLAISFFLFVKKCATETVEYVTFQRVNFALMINFLSFPFGLRMWECYKAFFYLKYSRKARFPCIWMDHIILSDVFTQDFPANDDMKLFSKTLTRISKLFQINFHQTFYIKDIKHFTTKYQTFTQSEQKPMCKIDLFKTAILNTDSSIWETLLQKAPLNLWVLTNQ